MTHDATTEDGRLHALDALRGVLALAVAVYHFFVVTHPFNGFARDVIVVLGIYAVQTFFVISGFCFFHLYADADLSSRTWRAFFLKRFFRIAPLYYVAIALSPLLDPPVYPHPSAATLFENVTLAFGFVHPNHAMVPGGWSIGVECVFYVLLPGLVWLTRPTGARWVLLVLLMALAIPATFWGVEAAVGHHRFHAYVALANHGFLFLLGGVIADLRHTTRMRLPPALAVAPIALLLAVVWLSPPFVDHLDVMVGVARVKYVAIATLTVWLVAHFETSHGPLQRALRHLGDWSYAVYLMHPFAWLIVVNVLPHDMPGSITLPAALCVTLLVAAVAHHGLERPLNQLGRRLARTEHFHVVVEVQRA